MFLHSSNAWRLAVLVCLTFSTSCDAKRYASLAEAALGELHSRITAGQDDQIFSEATPEYQKSMSAESSREFFKRIRSNFGEPHTSKLIGMQVNHVAAGTFLVCQFQTSFDKDDAQENVTWKMQDEKPRLVVYQVVTSAGPLSN